MITYSKSEKVAKFAQKRRTHFSSSLLQCCVVVAGAPGTTNTDGRDEIRSGVELGLGRSSEIYPGYRY